MFVSAWSSRYYASPFYILIVLCFPFADRPIQPKKSKHEEVDRLKKMITKNVCKAIEEQIRGIASDQKVHLSKKKEKNPEVDPNKMPPKQWPGIGHN